MDHHTFDTITHTEVPFSVSNIHNLFHTHTFAMQTLFLESVILIYYNNAFGNVFCH